MMKDKKQYVKVPLERLEELLRAEMILNDLECGGVDNWEGYDLCEFRIYEFQLEDDMGLLK